MKIGIQIRFEMDPKHGRPPHLEHENLCYEGLASWGRSRVDQVAASHHPGALQALHLTQSMGLSTVPYPTIPTYRPIKFLNEHKIRYKFLQAELVKKLQQFNRYLRYSRYHRSFLHNLLLCCFSTRDTLITDTVITKNIPLPVLIFGRYPTYRYRYCTSCW